MEEKQVVVQNETKSPIWRLGLVGVVIEGALGILLVCGALSQELAGAIMCAFAGVLAYCNGNNPNMSGAYNVKPTQAAQSNARSDREHKIIDAVLESPHLWALAEKMQKESETETEAEWLHKTTKDAWVGVFLGLPRSLTAAEGR